MIPNFPATLNRHFEFRFGGKNCPKWNSYLPIRNSGQNKLGLCLSKRNSVTRNCCYFLLKYLHQCVQIIHTEQILPRHRLRALQEFRFAECRKWCQIDKLLASSRSSLTSDFERAESVCLRKHFESHFDNTVPRNPSARWNSDHKYIGQVKDFVQSIATAIEES